MTDTTTARVAIRAIVLTAALFALTMVAVVAALALLAGRP